MSHEKRGFLSSFWDALQIHYTSKITGKTISRQNHYCLNGFAQNGFANLALNVWDEPPHWNEVPHE
jgi:hypothetical protein